MKITIKRSGGFAGIQMPPKVLETDDPKTIDEMHQIMHPHYKVESYLADGMQYDITVEEHGDTKSFIIKDNDDEVFQSLLRKVF